MTNDHLVIRGSSWHEAQYWDRSASRPALRARGLNVGLRVACSVPKNEEENERK